MSGKKDTETIVILSDDEFEPNVFSNAILSVSETGQNISDGNLKPHTAGNSSLASDRAIQNVAYMKKDIAEAFSLSSQKQDSGNLCNKLAVAPYVDSKCPESCKREGISKSKDRVNSIKSFVETVSTKSLNRTGSNIASKISDTLPCPGNEVLSDLRDSEDDPLETALKSVGRTQLYVPKPTSILKRQVTQLKTTLENRSGSLHKAGDQTRRFKPPSLDDWYKPILEIDYFAIVCLSSARKDESRAVNRLKEVPRIDDFHIVRFVHDDGDSATCPQLQAQAQAHAAVASGLLGHTELRLHMPPSITLASRGRLQDLRLQLTLLDREFDDLD
ncbi:unnamed protein product [Vicia faba]|uniref:Uncharacterized protein n=1 Tax=Vicia faba TaxID=3906 RepID=A0AAV1AJR1_VICFA|nr:unnamed protein product [Vicia faba]